MRAPDAVPNTPSITMCGPGGSPPIEDRQPWLMLDLGCRNPTDPNQEFIIDSTRLLFDVAPPERQAFNVDGHAGWFPNGGRGIAARTYRYKIETSLDNKNYPIAVDQTATTKGSERRVRRVSAGTMPVRETLSDAGTESPAPAVLEFTVFGKPAP